MTSWQPQLSPEQGPRYRAIADALADDIASGRLKVGERLPTHRELAFALGVTVGTVTRAYAEAERRGLIGGEVGRGTFVRSPREADTSACVGPGFDPLDQSFLPVPNPAGPIDLAMCQPPSPGVDRAIAAAVAGLAESGQLAQFLGYTEHGGMPNHRAAAALWLARQHRVEARPEQILITMGAQNGMAVALATVARPGDTVLTERLTYHGMKAVTATLGLNLEGVAFDHEGLIPEAFEHACRRTGVRALYIVPTLHNPTTIIMSAERRHAIAEIARHYNVIIIEDDVFGFLVPDAPPALQTLAPDVTIYLSSLSKSIAAGLRIGYLVAPLPLVARAEANARALNYSAPALMAGLSSRWILDGTADRFAETQREEARARQALARRLLPPGSVSHSPEAAHHLWLTLPEPWRREEFVHVMRQRGVALTGADVFAVGRGTVPHAVRLGLCTPASREEVARALTMISETLSQHVGAALIIV